MGPSNLWRLLESSETTPVPLTMKAFSMTVDHDSEKNLAARKAAAKVLGLEPDVGPDTARTLVWRQLTEVEFMPSPEWQTAARTRAQPGSTTASANLPARPGNPENDRLRDEVEELAEHFFRLSLVERRSRWQDLSRR